MQNEKLMEQVVLAYHSMCGQPSKVVEEGYRQFIQTDDAQNKMDLFCEYGH